MRKAKNGRCANCRKPIPSTRHDGAIFCSDKCGHNTAVGIILAGETFECSQCGYIGYEGADECKNGPDNTQCWECSEALK